MELIGSLGAGSAIAEMALALCGQDVTLTDIPYLQAGGARQRLLSLNPLGQVPVLVLDDGTAITQSAAIILYLDMLHPGAGLLPAGPARAAALNRLIWLVAAVYPTFTYGDFPERWTSGEAAQAELVARNTAHRCALMQGWEAQAGAGPHACGAMVSALDLYLVAITRWEPRRPWYLAHTPKLVAIAEAAAAHPALRRVVARHWP